MAQQAAAQEEADDEYVMQPFFKTIDSQNKDHNTHRKNHCEFTIPLRRARANGFTDATTHVKLTTRSLQTDPDYQANPDRQWYTQAFRTPSKNSHRFVIRKGWFEFSYYHSVERGWKLKFTANAMNRGATPLYVQRVMPDNSVVEL